MSRSRRRITTAAVLSVGLALPLLAGPPAFADPGGEMTAQEAIDAKVDSAVVSAIEADGTSSFWVHLDSRADLSETRDAAEVHDELIAHAQASQQGILDLLGQSETPYRSYWIVNAIHVDGDMSTLADLAVLADVSTIEPVSAFVLDTPMDGVPQGTVDGVEWGVADIKAPEVWDEFGNAGDDIVVATIDTGAQVDHPALIDSYRGNNGDGTFDHDYNFYDPYGLCGAAATCDNGGHGSHVVGTVVGADGDDDRIGVAPGATWITAVGCAPAPIDCPDTALLDSAQWILAPTDQNGDNPDPSKAPDIVNNSWGSNEDDPFFEEIGSAWRAAGIFSSWSIGNNGSAGCASAGAPGVYPDSFSSGAYDVDGNIGHFSARGPGRDGDVKPDLAAPGVNIRSAWPGSGYRAISGTSMAAPHTAGTVALMWAVSPALRGDVATTHGLLSATAQDVENLECGGTPENNNVFGDGRLDAFAAVSATPRGETGIVTGTVTAGGKPLAAATVTASGTASRQVSTDDEGQYVLPPLPVGDYEISAARFGYDGTSVSVTVEDGGLEVDLELTELDSATVTGTVTDGSGQGWPLDARVSVDGTDVSAQTDPVTGEFALDLPVGEHAVTVTVGYAGYETVHHVAAVGEHIDIEVPIAADCSAPGYRMTETATVLTEPFDAAGVPEGWEVDSRTELGWQFDDPADRGNLTGSVGGFAIADRDHYGVGTDMDTDLISPSFSLEGDTSAELSFASDFRAIGSSVGFVLVSDDDGQTWQELWRTPMIDDRGPSEKRIGLADFAAAASLRLAFRFDNAGTGRHWQVDAVRVGSTECVADPGGLIIGRVYDLNTGQPMSGVVVADDAAGTAVRTGEDGQYLLYIAGQGDRDVRFAKHGWDPVDTATSVAPGSVTIMDASLASGVLDVDAADIATYVTMDGSWTEEVSLANSGSAPVTVEFSPGESGYLPQVSDSAEVDRLDVLLGEAAAEGKDGPFDSAAPSVTGDWSEMPDYPMALRDAAATNGDGIVYVVGGAAYSGELADVYALDESDGSWQQLADLPAPRQYSQAEFHDGKLYVTGGWYGAWGRTYGQMYIYDPATDFWETAAVNPSPRAAAGSAVVDGSMYYIGGCIESDCTRDTNVSVYDPASDEWSRAADYPLPVAYPSCGGIHGKVVCAGGTTGTPTQRAFAYDPAVNAWSEVTSMPEDLWGSAHAVVDGELVISGGYADGGSALTNVGYAYDPVSDTWSGVSNAPTVKARAAGACGFVAVGGRLDGWEISPVVESLPGLDRCGDSASVPWLSVDKETVTIAPGEKITAEITVSAGPDDGAYEPGLYGAVVRIHHDSAGATPLVGVSMRVVPRADMGRLTGVVYRESCDGSLVPFGDAQVQVRGDDGIRRDMVTDESGGYDSWFVEGTHVVVASRDGYSSDFVILEIDRGRGATADLVLIELAC